MSKVKYQWHGEPVQVEFGNCVVKDNKDKPLWWWNYECAMERPSGMACIPVVRITDNTGYSFMIANHDGIGVHKLLNGGWPGHQHFTVSGKFSSTPELKYDSFDEVAFAEHEAARDKWQKETYPEEWEKNQQLRNAFYKIP